MSDGVLIGIDVGTSALKAAAYSADDGALLGHFHRRLPIDADEDGRREQDVAELERSLHRAFRKLRQQLGPCWSEIRGIGLASQAGSSILADRSTGNALTSMVLWNDLRGLGYLSELSRQRTPEYWQALALRATPWKGLGQLVMLRVRFPELMDARVIHVGAGEYLFHRLTGTWRQDAGHAVQMGYYDVQRRNVVPKLLDLAGVPRTFVAPMRRGHPTERLRYEWARRWGLSPDVLVAGPYMDHEAGYLSACGVSERPLVCSLGTAWVAGFTLPIVDWESCGSAIALPAPVGDGQLLLKESPAGSEVLNWATTQLIRRRRAWARRSSRAWLAMGATPTGVVCIPWHNQLHPYAEGSVGAGVFTGLGLATRAEDMVLAVATSLSFELARILEDVASSGIVDRVVLAGGSSGFRVFQQQIAVLFSPLPCVVVTDEQLSGTRGAIYPFAPKAATGAAVAPVKLPPARVQERLLRRYTWHKDLVARLGCPHGEAMPVRVRVPDQAEGCG